MNGSSTSLPSKSPSHRQPIRLNGHDRWFFCGRTGSGKSFLMKHLARIFWAKGGRVVIIDGPDHSWVRTKAEIAKRGPGTIDKPRLVRHFDPELRVQLFRPSVPGYADADLLAFLTAVFKEEKSLVIFDELFGILDPNHQPAIVMQLWSQGRKHDIACWAASQRPSRIPEIIMSQADNWAIFQLLNVDDKKKIADWTNSPQIRDERLAKRYWWYFNADLDTAQLMAPIKE